MIQPLLTFAAVAVPALLCAACASPAESASRGERALAGEFTVERIEDRPVLDRSPASLTFDADGRVHGLASINRFTGTWTLDGDALTLSPLATTRMAGAPALMEQEQRLLDALGRVGRADLSDGMLVLSSAEGVELVRASRVPAAVIRGTAAYRERIALAPGHTLVVTLEDVSRADAPSEIVAERTIDVEGQVPIEFELPYDPAALEERHRYSLRARLLDPAGELAWTTDTAAPVLADGTQDAPVRLTLRRVAR